MTKCTSLHQNCAVLMGASFYSPVDFTDAPDLHQSVQVWCIGEINRWI